MKLNNLIRLAGVLVTFVAVIGMFNGAAYAQQPLGQWSPQEKIPDYDDLIQETPPYLLTDQDRTVHAFNTQTVEESKAIVYRQWTLEQGWTPPIDIFYNEKSAVQVLGVFLDHVDVVHLVYTLDASLYYSKTPLVTAGQALAWSTPKLVAEQATSPFNGVITGDNKGNLVIIYAGKNDGVGTYSVYSDDNGDTWSEPETVSLAYSDNVSVIGIQVYMGQGRQLHVVWNIVNVAGHGESIHYGKLDIENKSWKDPEILATPEKDALIGLGVLFPSVIEYKDIIFATYYSGNVNGNWWRRSGDGGQTWSDPVRISPRHVGTNGAVSLVVDSDDKLHLFFGQRINDLNHGLWHSVWQGAGWSVPEAVVSGPHVEDEIGGEGFDPRSARAVVNQGNVVLVTWATDGIAGENGAWYSYTTLDTPELPARPLLIAVTTPPAMPSPEPTNTPESSLPTPRATMPAVANSENDGAGFLGSNPVSPLAIGLAPVVLLIIGVIVMRQFYRYNQR